jgi:mRNA interferase MazF
MKKSVIQGEKLLPRYGDVFLARLDPAEGHEQKGVRPVIVISGDATNDLLGLSVVMPLTSTLRQFPNRVRVEKDARNKLDADSDALTYQVRTLSHDRFTKKLGTVTNEKVGELLGAFIELCTM